VSLPTFFIAHGGGPCFDIDWPTRNPFAELGAYLSGFQVAVGRSPRAILVVSAHWETSVPAVTANARPSLIYDYTNFPPHTYALRYDVPGSPGVAARVRELLEGAGIVSTADANRGLDHGVFVPFRLMYPDATIPIVQLSILASYDPAAHIALGAALAPLRDEGVLIVGSGMSFHNLETIFDHERRHAERFDTWLRAAVTGDPTKRTEALTHWADAPSARHAHPEEDHLAPLFVAAGAATGEPAVVDFHGIVLNKPVSGFRFGDSAVSVSGSVRGATYEGQDTVNGP
jgi:aromatic ring-opening dioxygenase catalytic subunit (LigB family)